MKQAKPKERVKEKDKHERRSGDGAAAEQIDRNLLAELKALRRELADRKKVPAYIIFADATLVDMCKKLPTSSDELLEVSGVGRVKMELYGEIFLNVIRTYCK